MKHLTVKLLSCFLIAGFLVTTITSCEKDGPVEKPNGEQQNNKPRPEKPEPEKPKTFMDLLQKPLSDEVIYSKAVKLHNNSVIQGFDIDQYGGVFYLQIAGNSQQKLNLMRGGRTETELTEKMVFEYFGHGTNFALEEQSDGTYIWIGSYGNKADNGTYGGSQVISRIKYKSGTSVRSGSGEHFYLQGERNIHPAINQKQDLLGVTYTKGTEKRIIATYRMSEVMDLYPEQMKLSSPIRYGGEAGETEKTETPVIQARNLGFLKPLYRVEIPYNGSGMPFQGFDVEEDKFYYYEGQGNDNKSNEESAAVVIIVDKNGKELDRREVKVASDREGLDHFGMADRGYFEAEGIKVKKNVLYLGGATRKIEGTTDRRLANILRYKL